MTTNQDLTLLQGLSAPQGMASGGAAPQHPTPVSLDGSANPVSQDDSANQQQHQSGSWEDYGDPWRQPHHPPPTTTTCTQDRSDWPGAVAGICVVIWT